MRKRIKQFFKRSLAGFAALAMAVGSMSGLSVQAEETGSMNDASFTSHIPGEIVLENTGGDNLVLLQPLSAGDEFVFGADVTFTNPDEQLSAALIFGIRDNNLDDGHAMKANIHKKIDWNVPARVWGYGTDELRCPGETGQANRFFEDNGIDVTRTFRMEVSVRKNTENQYVLTYSLTNTSGEKVTAAQGVLKDGYTGGRFGLMTFASRAVFSNITVDGQKYGALEQKENGLRIHGVNGDAHVVSDVKLEPQQGFTYETDIDLAADTCSAALTFGIRNQDNPGEAWIGANFNFNDNNGAGGARVFQVGYGSGDVGSAALEGKLDRAKTIHAKLHVSSEGLVTYELYNLDNEENKVTVTGNLSDYQGGWLGLLTFDSSAVFSNTTCTLDDAPPAETDYRTNLGELTYAGGTWSMTENGLYSDATGRGDCFAFSEVQGTNFVYSTDIDFDGTEGAAALVFRSNRDLGNKECYAVNIDVGSHRCKFWRWQENEALQLIDEKEVPATEDEKYTLKVVAIDSWILYYVNDQLVASTGDYVLQPGNRGQNTVIKEGFFGLLNWNSKVTFQNTWYQELSGDFDPLLTDITVTSDVGTVEEKTQFTPTEPITIQYVKNDASAVNIEVARASAAALVEIRDAAGNIYPDGRNIPVGEGSNYITVKSTVTADDGTTAAVVYRVNVHRFKADEIYYNEAYRDQYHYSVKEGWGNDPNGLVYYKGTYHMFYQFYDDDKWGPMHWAHATSTDLIHWQEEPISLYPDANGAMFSGCIVVDEHNTSGFFDGIEGGGLVAIITADGNGQRIKLAYSTDEGRTWTKVDEIAADWTDDPLRDAAFRDPKVFRWEGKWFMVIAGGPLRIYSSDDLRSWRCEAAYADLHTECPDLYPIEAPDGQLKWVLSRGGRFYKVGDFKTVDGNWRFVPDAEYTNSDSVMNFGRDFYAAMTYYIQDFGTAANPTLPELVELNWMNTWDDYCNQVAETVGKDFNGTYNLNLKLGLIKDGDKYVLTQTPIDGYETLRQTENKQEWTQVTVDENNTILKDFVGDTYEILAKFYPEADTRKVGFKVRTGEGEETLIVYDLESQSLSIDRSRSGVIISGKFAEVTSQNVTVNEDGTVDLHIYVDKASVEVFAKGYTAAGAAQIFPSPLSVGAQVLVEGAAARADITIYPLDSIWTDKAQVTEPQHIGSTLSASQNMYVGDSLKLTAYVLPTSVSQEVIWSVKEGSDVAQVDATGMVTALRKGTAVIAAASAANPALTREFTIQVTENNFKTNIPEFVNVGGNWNVDDETLSVSNGGQNDYYMSAEAIEGDFVLETDIRYTRGLVNLFLASEGLNPHEGIGAYTIQFGYDTNVRLFPFGRDDFARGTMESAINDGAYHHVKVVKDGQRLRVYVDDVKCLEHTFEETEVFFAKGHVGIGLWDGALDVQNFFVHPLENPFTDVPEDSFYIDPVLWAVEEGITSGTTATTFHPGGVCVRAQVVTFLWRAAGSPEPDSAVNPFVDVAMDEYYCKAVMWAYEQGITAGMDETHFAPSAECTRAQVVTFLWRYLGQPQPTVTGHPFTDVAEDQFCFVPMLWAVENGITSGMTATTFAPNAICNRAQVVTFLYRAFAD
ncbi:MAG: GH32 C-terminal domain-containing protein [Oscillospiraceae bacterium]|nr:GH32 C-terminal domain-containing protein [Oscillospiraceae bacterium]